ncbi:uncharacterized protein BT62DRAFT_173322 [Guyanagaster necrorhizus]|uniref:Uncharacterized protein n=1 Tax=Guyanagaster necrorhizus TaxID=856835 RepID=A0A9P8ARS7_9AGAR|nr:uncharacterized protein BT62DRAFT_173322 [Guyanagaster necrorhizus MCA 3950]KAG7445683.1 hypothetical protein BT62DRAFT_173322 [Guyanagaster necrorhizus MCA 3950]
MHIINWLHMGLVFRCVERRVRRALDKIERDKADSVLRSGKTREAWMAMKATAKHMHAHLLRITITLRPWITTRNWSVITAQWTSPNVGRCPKRCTGYWIRLFCSRVCQTAGWRAHRQQGHDFGTATERR